MCAGCLEHTSLLSTVSREWEQRDNPIQIISIQRYPAYETEEQVEDTYGDEKSEFYAPWPVLITNTNATTLNGVSSNFSSVNSAFGNPGTPTMFIIDSNGDLRAKSVIYYLDGQLDRLEEQISDIQATT